MNETDKAELKERRVASLTDKELDALYTETRPVKAKRQAEHEVARMEMIRRGLLIAG